MNSIIIYEKDLDILSGSWEAAGLLSYLRNTQPHDSKFLLSYSKGSYPVKLTYNQFHRTKNALVNAGYLTRSLEGMPAKTYYEFTPLALEGYNEK